MLLVGNCAAAVRMSIAMRHGTVAVLVGNSAAAVRMGTAVRHLRDLQKLVDTNIRSGEADHRVMGKVHSCSEEAQDPRCSTEVPQVHTDWKS